MVSFATTVTRIDSFWQRIGRAAAVLSGVSVIFMTFLVVADVSLRFIFNSPIKGGVEVLDLALPYVIFLALAYTLVVGGHVRVTLLLSRFPQKCQAWAEILDCITGILFSALVLFEGWKFFWISFTANEYIPAEIFLPWWVGKFALPLGIFFLLVQFLIRLLVSIGRLINKIEVVEEEQVLVG